jgi:hypothetical protein
MKIGLFRRLVFASLTILTLGNLIVSPAFASNPRFRNADSTIVGTAGTLQVSWTEVSLGLSQTVDYLVTAKATAVYACINRAGIQNKTRVFGPIGTTTSFTADRTGIIRGSAELHPPGPGTFRCPRKQTLVLAAVTYQDDPIFDQTNSISTAVPDASKVYYP